MFSLTEKRIITFITKDHDPHLRDELYRCTLLWNGPERLIIGWADRFKICKIVRGSLVPASGHGLKASATTVANSIAATVLSSGAGSLVTSTDKKDFSTHVEISN